MEDSCHKINRKSNVLQNIAVDDQIGPASGWVAYRRYTLRGWDAGYVIHERLGAREQANHQIAAVASVVENAINFSIFDVLQKNWGESGAPLLV
jgi:hypothetical protein